MESRMTPLSGSSQTRLNQIMQSQQSVHHGLFVNHGEHSNRLAPIALHLLHGSDSKHVGIDSNWVDRHEISSIQSTPITG